MRVALLGGSNSVLKDGFSKGLSEVVAVDNYALGASSSIQNMYSTVKYINNGHYGIVTESNVNDFHNFWVSGVPLSTIKDNIINLYRMLYLANAPVFILLIPITLNKRSNTPENIEAVNVINKLHIKCACHYGFNYVDFHDYFFYNNLHSKIGVKLGHPNVAIMRYIGKLVGRHIKSVFSQAEPKFGNEVVTLTSEYLLGSGELKVNSKFNKRLFDVENINQKKLISERHDYYLIGATAWCDENSLLSISSKNFSVVKAFNTELQFHEFFEKISLDSNTIVKNEKIKPPTEMSLRAYDIRNKELSFDLGNIKLSDLLFIRKDIANPVLKNNYNYNCNYLLKELEVFFDYLNHELTRQDAVAKTIRILLKKGFVGLANKLANKAGGQKHIDLYDRLNNEKK
ncbi:SGNH/GDSL hydrolase family protein [Vibrio lentus]|uniref:Uncharacterized protein n=1 Tax=Vibrio lentus TaxID=136468 RepID=A0A2N7KEE4_9VIBR|nr:SGNH/GDSL hydrolase family protein [Vibrio lentus]PMM74059.1 hypothetical protein BCT49_24455 [Vibrio lentus]